MIFEWAPLLSLQVFVENAVSKVFYQLPLMSNWNLVSERTDNIITMLFRSLSGHSCIAEDLLKPRMSRYFSKILLSHQGHFTECAFFFCVTVNLISHYTEAITALYCHFTVPLILTASRTCDPSTAEGPLTVNILCHPWIKSTSNNLLTNYCCIPRCTSTNPILVYTTS